MLKKMVILIGNIILAIGVACSGLFILYLGGNSFSVDLKLISHSNTAQANVIKYTTGAKGFVSKTYEFKALSPSGMLTTYRGYDSYGGMVPQIVLVKYVPEDPGISRIDAGHGPLIQSILMILFGLFMLGFSITIPKYKHFSYA